MKENVEDGIVDAVAVVMAKEHAERVEFHGGLMERRGERGI